MDKYFRVDSDGEVKSVSDSLHAALELTKNSDSVCTLFGPLSQAEFQSTYKLLWPNGPSRTRPHLFRPSPENNRFCDKCGLYLTHELHRI